MNQNNNFNGMGNGFNNSTSNQTNGFDNQMMQNNNFNGMGNDFGNQGPASNDFQNNQQGQFNSFQNNNGMQNNGLGNQNNGIPNNQQFNPNFQNGQVIGLKPGNNTNSSNNKKIIPIVVVLVVIGVLVYFIFFNAKTVTCTTEQTEFGGLKTTAKITASFKKNKAVSANMEIIIDLSSQNSTVVDLFYEEYKASLEKEYGTGITISNKNKMIIAEMKVKAGDKTFEEILDTSADITEEEFIKQMETGGFTCESK